MTHKTPHTECPCKITAQKTSALSSIGPGKGPKMEWDELCRFVGVSSDDIREVALKGDTLAIEYCRHYNISLAVEEPKPSKLSIFKRRRALPDSGPEIE